MLTIRGIKARDLSINLERTKIDITKIMAANPRRIGEIKVVINFPENLHADEKQRTMLARAAMTCPVFESLLADLKKNVDFNWEKVEKGLGKK